MVEKSNLLLLSYAVGMCRPPRKTLEENNERFENFLKTLPYYEITEKGTELRICYRAIKITHDEVDRDSQVIALKLFNLVLRKAVALIEPAHENIKGLGEFSTKELASDINEAILEAPKTLLEVAELYVSEQKCKAT